MTRKEKMKQILITWILPIVSIFIGIYLQLDEDYKAWGILPRIGAGLVIFGVILESKYILRIVGDDVYTGAETLIVGKVPTPKSMKERLRQFSYHIGLIWVIIGTFIWAMGDLINKLTEIILSIV